MGIDPPTNGPKIPVHQFQAIAAQWARGDLTGAQAQTAVTFVSGAPLTPGEVTQAQALVATVTSLPAGDARTNRMQRIDGILLLAETRCPPYDTAALTATALGI